MRKKINFTKMVASGNDFVLCDLRKRRFSAMALKDLAKEVCQRRLGIGADGLLVLEHSAKADMRMRIFNADGTEAEMCGNGARCAAYFICDNKASLNAKFKIQTKAGILLAKVNKDTVQIKMTEPQNINLDSFIKIKNHTLRFSFINTGVPHTVILCDGIEGIDVAVLGRIIRFHRKFKPAGTNVDFLEPLNLEELKIRTYERGVEEETLACGTGAVASAIIYCLKLLNCGLLKDRQNYSFKVHTASGENLKVYFKIVNKKIKDVWLEGKAKVICRGEFYV